MSGGVLLEKEAIGWCSALGCGVRRCLRPKRGRTPRAASHLPSSSMGADTARPYSTAAWMRPRAGAGTAKPPPPSSAGSSPPHTVSGGGAAPALMATPAARRHAGSGGHASRRLSAPARATTSKERTSVSVARSDAAAGVALVDQSDASRRASGSLELHTARAPNGPGVVSPPDAHSAAEAVVLMAGMAAAAAAECRSASSRLATTASATAASCPSADRNTPSSTTVVANALIPTTTAASPRNKNVRNRSLRATDQFWVERTQKRQSSRSRQMHVKRENGLTGTKWPSTSLTEPSPPPTSLGDVAGGGQQPQKQQHSLRQP
mmetsp:Transcript_24604/g.93008  ORF Transcript_24604/g.93008 Transcript_24604/m.93008 type:complete len:321 (-) Transcript_24604:6007-6969(-)